MSSTLTYLGKQIVVYCGIPLLAIGIVGDCLNILVFLSLQTFRQNSCSFYLTIMSIVNIGQLCFGLLSRIMIVLADVDGTETSFLYCKLKLFLFYVCIGISLTCLCAATIDQYCATCTHIRWQQWCNIKLARSVIVLTILIWILHGIPYLIFYEHSLIISTQKLTCTITNHIFIQYRAFVILIVLLGYLPIGIAVFFGLLAFHNIQQLSYRTVPLVRRELDKQLTVMVLVQVLMSVLTVLPYTTVNGLANTNVIKDTNMQAQLQFALTITLIIYYTYFASPFYIYMCVSERFRRQLIYVLCSIYLKRFQRPRILPVNQAITTSQKN